ncbi:MAG: hypothetical protein AAF561_12745 [Planctomycetota bacterium]
MAPQEIRKHHIKRPFRPFRIHMNDGSEYEVTDPFHMTVNMLDVVVGWDPDEGGIPTRSMYLSPSHVSRIEPLDMEPIEEKVPGSS